MAITIQQQPQLYTPVYNPMRFVLSSTNAAQTNFKYVVDLYVSGVAGRVWRGLYNPDPTYATCGADVSRILESYLTYDISDTVFGFQQCTNSLKGYEVKFGEQYGASSGIATYTDLTVTGLKYAWNGVLKSNTFRTFNYSLYTVGGGGATLSNMATTQYYTDTTQRAYQYMLNDTSGMAYFAKILTYDVNNALLGTYRIANSYQASTGIADKLVRVGVGAYDLNNATLYTGIQPVITASVNKYTVEIVQFNDSSSSPVYTYNVECNWHGISPQSLHFLNRLGGFDVFNFRLQRTQFSDIKRSSMEKNLGTLTATTWSYNSIDRGNTTYNTEISDRWTLTSDWIIDAQAIWLQELFESPEVYYHDGSTFIPVTIKNNTTEIKTIKNMEKLFNITVDIEFSNKRWTQRG